MIYRTHSCNALRAEDSGDVVTLSGWVDSPRDHGGVIFIDLRDREGITQVVFRPEESPEAATLAHSLRGEDVVRVTGTVALRLAGTENTKLATGGIEVVAETLEILNKSETIPFPLDAELSNEDLRLGYRYLDLRRAPMLKNLTLRHKAVRAVREYMDRLGFLEIETPILTKSTPEGAREFLVPSRLMPGHFFALSQSPQQYKQLLMVAGLDRYFQIARCFRDEDPRADRLIELTQVDVEMAFVGVEQIIELTEGMLAAVFEAALGKSLETPFCRLTWREAMNRYGSDKPDRRFGMELVDLGFVFQKTEFKVFRAALDKGGVVKAFNAKGFARITAGQINELTELAQKLGAKGLAYIKAENGEWKSPIVKFFTAEEKKALRNALEIEEGDLVLFGADSWQTVVNVLGRIRLRVAEVMQLSFAPDCFECLWVTEFPLLEHSAEEDKWNAVHHPFTRPMGEDLEALENGRYGEVRAEAYDVVINGLEIGGGSIRIHERDLQQKLFHVLGISEVKQQALFPHLLKAFTYGAPPHGGIALGVDRLTMLLAGTTNIRDVVAFPKTNKGQDLMVGSPTEVAAKQLNELGLAVKKKG